MDATTTQANDEKTYGIDELADLGGVTRRTVRYYVQEQLLPPPLGVGRGRHYGSAHLEALLTVKALQERGESLDTIRRVLRGEAPAPPPPSPPRDAVHRETVTRLVIAPGLELLVLGPWRLPPPGQLAELAETIRASFRRDEEEKP